MAAPTHTDTHSRLPRAGQRDTVAVTVCVGAFIFLFTHGVLVKSFICNLHICNFFGRLNASTIKKVLVASVSFILKFPNVGQYTYNI